MFLLALTITFLSLYAALLLFYFLEWKKVKTFEPAPFIPTVFISIIIAARNEEHTLPSLVSDLLQQDYPAHLFEVIIVNDFSTDATANILKQVDAHHFKMIAPNAETATSSKKKAIAAGIKEAKGELLLITDADCRVKKNWVQTIVAFYQQTQAVFIAAPVKFIHNHSWLQLFQALDFITLQGITAASVNSGFHTMCNGANLAYTKKVFNEVNGFEGIDHIPTGDDMLLMHKIWKKYPDKVAYLKSADAIVSTLPTPTWKEFFMQRLRWASKALVYKDYRILLVLCFVLAFSLLGIFLLIVSVIHPAHWPLIFIYFGCKTIIEWPIVSAAAAFYEEKKIMRWFIFFQPLHLVYTLVVGLWSQVGKYEWKGRVASAKARN